MASISLSQNLATYGISLSYGQIGQGLSATALDCKGQSVSVNRYTYASTNGYIAGAPAGQVYADINPATGSICAGTWNRQTGGGVADYTVCTAPAATPTNYIAYVTATSEGATSNAIPVFVHAQPNSIQIGSAASCPAGSPIPADPSSNCCPLSYTAPQPTNVYLGDSCKSQGQTGQVVARIYDINQQNITCQVGPITYGVVGATNAVTFDQNGVGTANQPGSATITATIAGSASSSTAGFWSTCAPKSIQLFSNNSQAPVTGLLGVTTPFNAVVTDTAGNPITGLALEYVSSTPETIQAGSNSITPTFPGNTTITAVCTPPSCNTSPYSQIDLYGNGTTLTSNGIQFSVAGQSSSVIYIASTQSQYIYPYDFTSGKPGTLVKLPYVPNSMVISVDGSTIYFGSSTALMTVSAANNSVTSANVSVTGTVLSVSPTGGTLVVTDPLRETVSLVSSAGAIETQQGGVATSAAWSPDSSTVYITTKKSASYPPQLLVYNANTSWTALTPAAAGDYTDVAVTVPHVGAYFSSPTTSVAAGITEGHTYCPINTISGTNTPVTVNNTFYPRADTLAVPNERIAATNDGAHMIGAVATPAATLNDAALTIPYQQVCGAVNPPTPATPTVFSSTNTAHVLAGVTATDITNVNVSSNSKAAFVTYTGSGPLPLYLPASGAVSNVALSGSPTAPVVGVFSSNDAFFYVGTAGDNLVHILAMTYPSSGNPTATDTQTLTPGLPNFNDTTQIATPNLIVQRVKKPTT